MIFNCNNLMQGVIFISNLCQFIFNDEYLIISAQKHFGKRYYRKDSPEDDVSCKWKNESCILDGYFLTVIVCPNWNWKAPHESFFVFCIVVARGTPQICGSNANAHLVLCIYIFRPCATNRDDLVTTASSSLSCKTPPLDSPRGGGSASQGGLARHYIVT